jgi:hypothetical protein
MTTAESTYSDANLSLTGRSALGFPLATDGTSSPNYAGNTFDGTIHYSVADAPVNLPQAITFSGPIPTNAVVGGPHYQVVAIGGASGQPVTFSSDTPSLCTVTTAGVVSFDHVGTCAVEANQAGAAGYDPAPSEFMPINIGKGSQTIAFTSTPPANASIGTSYGVAANGGGSMQPVRFSTTSSACTIVAGTTVLFTNSGTCTVAANQAGNDDFTAAPTVTQTINVKQTQKITITTSAPVGATSGDSYDFGTSSTGSNNPVVVTSLTPSICKVAAPRGGVNRVTLTQSGTCTIAANKAGNSVYEAAPQVTQTVQDRGH